ncbi:hypothetical protein SDC9_146337 [bioreactor metagenome]|uniref:Uncharacterized protein n=1 Tax=bioreactor metagenome TaxID=1076179 RepID=A0A645EBT6_9ZZZZ
METVVDKVKEVMLAEINKLFNQKDNEAVVKLYNVALIYFKNQLFDDIFENIVTSLVEKNKYLRESYIMISHLKKNNKPKMFDSIMETYKEKFVEAEIISEKLKPHKSLNNKNIVKELKFKES